MSIEIKQNAEAFAYLTKDGFVVVDSVSSSINGAKVNALLCIWRYVCEVGMTKQQVDAQFDLLNKATHNGNIVQVGCVVISSVGQTH